MKYHSKSLVCLGIGVIALLACRPTNKAESMGDTTTGVDHVVVNAPNAPGSQKMGNGIHTTMFIEKLALGNIFVFEIF